MPLPPYHQNGSPDLRVGRSAQRTTRSQVSIGAQARDADRCDTPTTVLVLALYWYPDLLPLVPLSTALPAEALDDARYLLNFLSGSGPGNNYASRTLPHYRQKLKVSAFVEC